MFNADNYNDNIEYCQYVYEKNIELDLGLNTPNEIQYVANNYLDEVYARRGIIDDEVYENDKLLSEVVAKFMKKFSKFKPSSERYIEEKEEIVISDSKIEVLPEIDIKNKIIKDSNRNGGYSYNESYDDINDSIKLK